MKCVLTPSSALTLTSFVTSRAEDKPLVFLCSKCYSIVWNGSLHQCSNLDLFVEFAHVRDVSSCSNMADSSRAVEREWIKASVKVDLARRVSTQKLGDLSAQLGECGESLRERGKRRKNGRFLRRTFRARRRRRNERRASRRVVGAPPKGARRRVEGEFRSQGAPKPVFVRRRFSLSLSLELHYRFGCERTGERFRSARTRANAQRRSVQSFSKAGSFGRGASSRPSGAPSRKNI